MYQIQVKVQFRIGHRLIAPYKGKCSNVHGEGLTAIFVFEQDSLDASKMVVDFGKVKKDIKAIVDEKYDHAYLYNRADKIGILLREHGLRVFELEGNPTAENIARYLFSDIYQLYPNLIKVGIVESFDDNIAWYAEVEKRKDKIC